MPLHAFFKQFLFFPRVTKVAMLGVADVLTCGVAFVASLTLLGLEVSPASLITGAGLTAVTLVCGVLGGLYRTVLRYGGRTIVQALARTAGYITLVIASLFWVWPQVALPVSVPLLFWTYALMLIAGGRFLLHTLIMMETRAARRRQRVAIYGAGQAGVLLLTALQQSVDYDPVAFIDDNPALTGSLIYGRKVHTPDMLETVIQNLGVTHVILAIPSLPVDMRRAILKRLEPYPVRILTTPPLEDMIYSTMTVSALRDVSPEELMLRAPVQPRPDLMAADVTDAVVMVTGGGGSIGLELCRQILKLNPARLVVFERSEYALYEAERRLRALLPPEIAADRLHCVLASVNNPDRLRDIITRHGVQTIYHAAAYKHVPIIESSPLEGLENNVFGTLHVAQTAMETGVRKVVLISTDKAVRSASVMGASKRIAELTLQALQPHTTTTVFAAVRFGNVLDSKGSVLPLFRRQIADGGPVTVTHPDVSRYFMTITEATELVIQAGAMAEGGDIFILDMGEPLRLKDLAERLIRLSGLSVQDDRNPDGDIEISYIGLRPGEKLHEELFINDSTFATSHEKVWKADDGFMDWDDLEPQLYALQQLAQTGEPEQCALLMRDIAWNLRSSAAADTAQVA